MVMDSATQEKATLKVREMSKPHLRLHYMGPGVWWAEMVTPVGLWTTMCATSAKALDIMRIMFWH